MEGLIMENMIIGEVEGRNLAEKVVGTIVHSRGGRKVDLRVNFLVEPSQWIPTRKGFSLDLTAWKKFKKLVRQIDKELKGSKE
jgi:hypothetical protein